MYSNDKRPSLPVRSVVRAGADSGDAVVGNGGLGVAVLLRPVSPTTLGGGRRGSPGTPGSSTPGQGPWMSDYPITIAFVCFCLLLGAVGQAFYA
jgi:hypothetical protein